MGQAVVLTEQFGKAEADIVAVQDYEGFASIAAFLVQIKGAEILSRTDGPESRVWEFVLEGKQLTLTNNPYGNTLKARAAEANALVVALAEDLEQRLSGVA